MWNNIKIVGRWFRKVKKTNTAFRWFSPLSKFRFFLFEWRFANWPCNVVILLGFLVSVPFLNLIFGICGTRRDWMTLTIFGNSSLLNNAFYREKHCVWFAVLRILPEWGWYEIGGLVTIHLPCTTWFEYEMFSLSLKWQRRRSIADMFQVCLVKGFRFGCHLELVTFIHQGKEADDFSGAIFFNGCEVRAQNWKALKGLNKLLPQNKRISTKEQVLNITSKAKKLANMLHQAHTNWSKQANFWKLVIILLKIKYFMMINFILLHVDKFYRDYDDKFYIKIFGICPTIDL